MRRIRTTTVTALVLAGALGLAGCGSQSDPDVTATSAMTTTATSSMDTEPMTPESMDTESMDTESMDTESMDTESMTTESMETAAANDATTTPGAYLTLAEYQAQMAQREGTTVVYFFHAPWCPSCRATEESVTADGVPDGLTIVKVDYDSEIDLRRQYGITYQHTFVQVDEDGNELAKWTGTTTAADIQAETV